jgi:hypothetical protein
MVMGGVLCHWKAFISPKILWNITVGHIHTSVLKEAEPKMLIHLLSF